MEDLVLFTTKGLFPLSTSMDVEVSFEVGSQSGFPFSKDII
jgi:hypothetical protein